MFRLNLSSRVVAVSTLALLASCETTQRDVLGPSTPTGGDMFQSYVALGNSITAGYQSGGINDSTQRQSYARWLAQSMGTQYHYASLNMPGCPPPIANTQTGARVAGGTSTTCAVRASASVTDILNNVAVPGPRVLDPVSSTTVASNALTTFVLGGKSQVQRALDARPTFVSAWIGNNDVLEAGLSGIIVPIPGISPGIVSTQAQFMASYDAMIKQLTDSMPNLKGLLIGVVQVSGVPQLSSGALIAASPAIQAGISQAAGMPVTVHPNCTGSASLVNVVLLIPAIRGGTHPPLITCAQGSVPGQPLLGDVYILDAAEQQTLGATIQSYHDYIKGKAQALGWAFYDPNILLAAKKASGEIPPFPNLASATTTFGAFFSLDGVHPSAAAHLTLANDMIATINAKYGTKLPTVP